MPVIGLPAEFTTRPDTATGAASAGFAREHPGIAAAKAADISATAQIHVNARIGTAQKQQWCEQTNAASRGIWKAHQSLPTTAPSSGSKTASHVD